MAFENCKPMGVGPNPEELKQIQIDLLTAELVERNENDS